MAQKIAHRKRVIVRQIHAQHAIAIQLLAGGTAGWCGVGEQDLMIWVSLLQPSDETLRSAGLPHRHGVQPNDRPVATHGIKTKRLTDVAHVFRLLARAPDQPKKNIWE